MSLGDSLALMRSRGQGGYGGQVQCNETESLLSISCWRHAESDTSGFFCKPIVRPLMNVPVTARFTHTRRHHDVSPKHPRPFMYMPRAGAIDALLRKVLGEEMFAQITLM
jgi:hypothetical protein